MLLLHGGSGSSLALRSGQDTSCFLWPGFGESRGKASSPPSGKHLHSQILWERRESLVVIPA